MSYKICLKKKNYINYIIITNKSSHPKKLYIEKLGFYYNKQDLWRNKYCYVNFDRVLYWLSRGAKMNISVYSLLRSLILIKKNIYEK